MLTDNVRRSARSLPRLAHQTKPDAAGPDTHAKCSEDLSPSYRTVFRTARVLSAYTARPGALAALA